MKPIVKESLRYKIGSGIDRISRGAAYMAAVVGAVLMLQIVLDVIMRNMVNEPLMGTPEFVANWWMPAIVFLGLAYAEMTREHLTVTLATDGASTFGKKVASWFSRAIIVAMVCIMLNYGFTGASQSFVLRESVVADMRLEIWPGKIVMFLGLIIWLLQIIGSILKPEDEVGPKKAESVVA